jgi:type IV pilus assembly protein PilC
MSYPLIVLSISLVLVFVLLTFVVPQFAKLFQDANEKLPALTSGLLWASHHVTWGFGGIIAFVAILFCIVHFKMLPETTLEQVERIKFGTPVFGSLAKKTAVARASSTLADLIAAGVPLLESCRLAATTAGSRVLNRALTTVGSRVSEGSTFARALSDEPAFPEMLVQFVAVGEESGSLATLMTKYSETAEEEVAASADNLTALLNPVMIIIVGAIVGTCIIGLYLPILNLGNTIK